MSAPGSGKPTLTDSRHDLPGPAAELRDPRLHLAAVIVSLQILGQVAFEFRLSIAQILVSLLTCAVLEMGIAMRRQHVILWPASALLTGNGVAFILRVPGTEHGDWWSMNGWWIFAGTAAVSLLSKHLIQFRGGHIFNPSNFGLVLCFLLLGPEHADPLAFWWGPMSFWLALALAIIIGGGFAILRRLRLLHIADHLLGHLHASIAVIAASGHDMTANWHLGPVSDWYFWRVLAFSPEILVFLFFMITDPKTIPAGTDGAPGLRGLDRVARGAAARPADDRVRLQGGRPRLAGDRLRGAAAAGAARRRRPPAGLGRAIRRAQGGSRGRCGGARRRRRLRRSAGRRREPGPLERRGDGSPRHRRRASSSRSRVKPAQGIAPIDERTAQQIARDLVADLENESAALRGRDRTRATAGADGARLAALWRQIAAPGGAADVPRYAVERIRVTLEPGDGQAPPTVVARASGTVTRAGHVAPPRRDLRARAEGRPLPDHRRSPRIGGGGVRRAVPLRRPRRRAAAGRRRAGRARLHGSAHSGSGSPTSRTR